MPEHVTTLRRLLDSTIEDLEQLHAPYGILWRLLQASALVRSEELRLANLKIPDNWPNAAPDPVHSMAAAGAR